MDTYNSLQMREVFHIEFLRQLGRKVKAGNYAVKGGVNLRLFFKSFRYSEDMDLDVSGIRNFQLKEAVMSILDSRTFRDNLKPFGITDITPPDIVKAKQTETTQRFKAHLFSSSGDDLFTKIEFSRRGFTGTVVIDAVDDAVLREYKLPPILVPHYNGNSAAAQKILALAGRTSVQARDIFDLYILSSQYDANDKHIGGIKADLLSKAHERIFEVGFGQFRDTVISYLSVEDRKLYNRPKSWEEIQLKTAGFIEEARNQGA